jgi:hypothetical protein
VKLTLGEVEKGVQYIVLGTKLAWSLCLAGAGLGLGRSGAGHTIRHQSGRCPDQPGRREALVGGGFIR